MKNGTKIFGIGLNKTGTKTLGKCFSVLGLSGLSYDMESFEWWCRGEIDRIYEKVADYDAFEDWPWPILFRDLDKRFPGSKFILTRRKNSNIWYASLCRHMRLVAPSKFERVIYGTDQPKKHRKSLLGFYEKHLRETREYFLSRPTDFLEVCWEDGDNWNQLCQFLDLPLPQVTFPHENRHLSKKSYFYMYLGKLRKEISYKVKGY